MAIVVFKIYQHFQKGPLSLFCPGFCLPGFSLMGKSSKTNSLQGNPPLPDKYVFFKENGRELLYRVCRICSTYFKV
jgi:hypothetical protein